MVIDEIKQILAKQLRIDANTINDNSNIIEDLGADSIDLVELLMTIEEKKGIVVSDEDAVKLKTVKDVADYIEQHS
ncbi:MAG: acyl carrier protein [Ruminococcus sp.]|nr:acyl carrier protein [Ruminococcus sp.]MDD6300230.1 acyl carrier protein [Ruminococcus sp.]MDD7671025.1 acyl carrier protein [Ruminococcus sp.]MDY2742978.1 acyl carrier protein [Eubacteriales bacterium]CDD02597.1 apicoplast ACP [Ruminococcus sp. CAG:382]